jgi:ATP-dependent Lon protease
MATALVSLLTGRTVKPNVGMTGELTLRGKVLPIGGLKEKVLAARRAGLDTVIMPYRNEKDLDDLTERIRSEMTFIFAEQVDDVLNAALNPAPAVVSSNGHLDKSLTPSAQATEGDGLQNELVDVVR